jgi:hypothetical protein
VQYPEGQIRSLDDLRSIPLRGPKLTQPTRLDMVSRITRIEAPTEVDHYQIRRTLDIYVRPHGENLGRITDAITKIIGGMKMPQGIEATLRGSAEAMRLSLRSFALGLSLSVVLLYLVLVAQFVTPLDPEDLHSLGASLDDVLDYIEDAAFRLSAYRIDPVPPGVSALTSIIHSCALRLGTAVGKLRTNGNTLEAAWKIPPTK